MSRRAVNIQYNTGKYESVNDREEFRKVSFNDIERCAFLCKYLCHNFSFQITFSCRNNQQIDMQCKHSVASFVFPKIAKVFAIFRAMYNLQCTYCKIALNKHTATVDTLSEFEVH